MVVISYSGKEANAKIVYYGPGLGGKTTNLEFIYDSVPASSRGKMVSMKTQTDRTLFFDFLPLDLGELGGFKTRFLLYTVPGQVFYNATRKLVLRGADAVAFIADSEIGKMDENKESLANLIENLAEYDLSLDGIPWVIQYNKRDLSEIYTIEELNRELNPGNVPSFEAVATEGVGVFETFRGLSRLLLEKLSEEIGHRMVIGRSFGRRKEQDGGIGTLEAEPVAKTEHCRRAEVIEPQTVEPETVETHVPQASLEAIEPEKLEAETVEPDAIEPVTMEPETVEANVPPASPEAIEPEKVEAETIEPQKVEAQTVETHGPQASPEAWDVDEEELEIMPEESQARSSHETLVTEAQVGPGSTIAHEREMLQGFFGETVWSPPLEKEIVREEVILSNDSDLPAADRAPANEQATEAMRETGERSNEQAAGQPDEQAVTGDQADRQVHEQVRGCLTASEQPMGNWAEMEKLAVQAAKKEMSAEPSGEEPFFRHMVRRNNTGIFGEHEQEATEHAGSCYSAERPSLDVKSLEQVIEIPASMLVGREEKEIVITLRLRLKADAENSDAPADEFLLDGISR